MQTVIVTDHVELASGTLCFFHNKHWFETEKH